MRLSSSLQAFVLIALLSSLLMAAPVWAESRITVTGHGQATVEPDHAVLVVGVNASNQQAHIAMQQVATSMTALMQVLDAAGIAPKDRQTRELSLSPRWEHNNNGSRHQNGFLASNTLSIQVRDLTQVGELIDRLSQTGANRFDSISFGRFDMQAAEDQARHRAVQDAMRKAALYAQSAGVSLGALRQLSEGGVLAQPVGMVSSARMSFDQMPVAAGSMNVSASVTMVYTLANP